MIYSLARPLLFKLPPETSHDLALRSLKFTPTSLFTSGALPDQPKKVMGIEFPNPVGLAAGLDKNADYFNELGRFGFGFVEVGSITPKPQPGNPKPRMFRLKDKNAVINRMGFNNKGVDHLVQQVKQRRYQGVLGINIGKNLTTPLERAHEDYQICMDRVYPYADYITVNISSPNTPGLRDLQLGESLTVLLKTLKASQQQLADTHGKYVPVAVKISPDMADEDIDGFCDAAMLHKIDGIIAGNTTSTRTGVEQSPHVGEAGGLSGAPLTVGARATIARLAQRLQGELPVIGCGGICSGEDAAGHLQAGADLVQIYTGLVFRGPALVKEVRQTIQSGIPNG